MVTRVRVKICCISSVEEARVAIDAGADAIGLVGRMPSGPGPIADGLIATNAAAVPPAVGTLTPLTAAPELWQRAWFPVVTVFGALLSGLLVFRFAPAAEGHGTDAYIRAFHRLRGRIRGRVPIIKTIASAITIGSGGSAGREGPIAQIGAGFGSWLGQVLRLDTVPSDLHTRL